MIILYILSDNVKCSPQGTGDRGENRFNFRPYPPSPGANALIDKINEEL